jgi:hypothetical protein
MSFVASYVFLAPTAVEAAIAPATMNGIGIFVPP